MRVYKFCSISNIDQNTKIFAFDFSYFVKMIAPNSRARKEGKELKGENGRISGE